MFPGTLDTKEGQAAAIKATMDMAAASVCLHDAARYIAMADAHQMATGETNELWIDLTIDSVGRALSAIGYRMVPVDQPTPEEARRQALEEVDSRLVDLHWSASDDAEAGRVLALLDTRNIVWAMLSEPSK